MKQYIFLVEDIVDNRPITLTEKLYQSVLSTNRKERVVIPNFDETITVLNSDLYKIIKFIKIKEFIHNVGLGNISENFEVYYFINTIHSLQSFHFSNLLALDIEVINFLKKHNIPVIIDSAMEITHPYDFLATGVFTKFFNKGLDITGSEKFQRGVESLDFIIVHPMYRPAAQANNYYVKNDKIKNVMFPTAFFDLRPKLLPKIVENRDELFCSIKEKKLQENTAQWIAYSYTQRLNRMLFFMRIYLESLNLIGKYSLLLPQKNEFVKYYKNIYNEIPWVTEELTNVLNDIKILDPIDDPICKHDSKPESLILPRKKCQDVWYNIVLETFDHRIDEREDLDQHTMLTEKTAKAIVEGLPFLHFGGKDNIKILKHFGFKLYPNLNFEADKNLYKNLNQVIEKMKWLDSLSLDNKNKLNDDWKEIIMYNYDHYSQLNASKLYIQSLKTDPISIFQ